MPPDREILLPRTVVSARSLTGCSPRRIALAVVVAVAGIDFKLGAVSIRSHSAVRVLAASIVLAVVRWRIGIASLPPWLTRIALLTLICGSVVTWFRFLLTTIGGADSYGYVSASRMIAGGRLIDPAPVAEWLTAPNRLAIASPLGWTPAPDGSGIAPTFPIGTSMLMALFSLAGAPGGVLRRAADGAADARARLSSRARLVRRRGRRCSVSRSWRGTRCS